MEFKLSENVTKQLLAIAAKMSGSVRVGYLEGATYPNGTPVATVMYLNEFGHGGNFPAPPRPTFRPMISKESPTWGPKMGGLAKATDYDGAKVLALMGEDIEGALKESVIETSVAPLAHSTLVLRKKFGNSPEKITLMDVLDAQRAPASDEANGTQAKPLIWTGHALNSTGYEVDK